jgi:hypothetical protein
MNPTLAITSVNVGLDATSGRRAFRRHSDGQVVGVGPSPESGATLSVATVDEFVTAQGLSPDFVKIDVEGMELDVLRGGQQTFQQYIQTIILELHYDALERHGQSTSDVQGLLEGYGYKMESLEGATIADLARYASRYPEPLPGYTVVVCRKHGRGV